MSPQMLRRGAKQRVCCHQIFSASRRNIFCRIEFEGFFILKKSAHFGNLWGLMTLSAKSSENYFLIGPKSWQRVQASHSSIPHWVVIRWTQGDRDREESKKVTTVFYYIPRKQIKPILKTQLCHCYNPEVKAFRSGLFQHNLLIHSNPLLQDVPSTFLHTLPILDYDQIVKKLRTGLIQWTDKAILFLVLIFINLLKLGSLAHGLCHANGGQQPVCVFMYSFIIWELF